MEARYIQRGDAIDYIPHGDMPAGAVVILGAGLVGVAKLDIKAGELGAVALTGVYEVKKSPTAAFVIGEEVAWDHVARQAVPAGTFGSLRMGHSVSVATFEHNTVPVRLCPGLC